MRLFATDRSKRRSAFVALLAWLFALGSGWANACVLEDSHIHLHGFADQALQGALASHVAPGRIAVDCDHPSNGDAAKRFCLKVCADQSRTIAKTATSVDLTDVAMAPHTLLAWNPRRIEPVSARIWLELPAPSPGLPLRTRYSRLAL